MGVTDAVQVAAGGQHTCVVKRTRQVACWGLGTLGRLGYAATAPVSAPALVPGLADVIRVTAGLNHTCALLASGKIKCWGSNAESQLGSTTPAASQPVPVEADSISDAVAVSAGDTHTCAVLASGEVKCWGANGSGRLGDGTLDERHAATGYVAELTNIAQVSAGTAHACAVHAKGKVLCWGSNATGQLGDGTVEERSVPVEAVGIDDAVQVSAGARHSCAVHASGRVSCWGANDVGQLGDGMLGQRTSPFEVSGLTDAVQVSAGVKHTCVVRKDGRVLCWGENDNGELGDGSIIDAPTPVQVLRDDGQDLRATQVSVGTDHTCVTSADGVACWGVGTNGRRGDGTATEVHRAVGIGTIP